MALEFTFTVWFCRWETAGSPHRLAWFWLQVLEKHSKDKVKYTFKYKRLR